MNQVRRRICLSASLLPFATLAQAQGATFPNKPMRIIVPVGPGSASDAASRFLAEALAGILKQPVIVDNRPGADTAIAVRHVLQQPDDGHTLLQLANSTVEINPFIIPDLSYDPKDIRPVAGMLKSSCVFVSSSQSKYKSWDDVVRALRDEPRSVSLGNYGQIYRFGSMHFEQLSGLNFLHVPYKSASQASTDVIGGSTDLTLLEVGGALPLIQGKQLRALAVASPERLRSLPDTPTIAELGWPEFTLEPWAAFAVSSRTPEPLVRILEDAILQVARSDEWRQWCFERNSQPMPFTAQQMNEIIKKESAAFSLIAKSMAAS